MRTNIPLVSLLLTLFLLPWYIVRFSVFSIPFTLLEVSILVTIIAWVIAWLGRTWGSGWRLMVGEACQVIFPSGWWALWLALFLVAATIGVIIAPDFRQALGIYKAYIWEPLLLYIVVRDAARQPDHRRLMIGVLSVASVIVSFVCLSQWLWHWPNITPAELAQGRSSAFFNSANDVGLFMAPIVLLALAEGIRTIRHHQTMAWWWFAVDLLGLLAILASRSKGAMFGLLVAGGLFLGVVAMRHWASWQRWWKVFVVWLVMGYAIGISIYLGVFNHPPQVANPYTRPGFTTFTVRQCVWQGTVAMLKTTPVLGAGLAGFTDRYLEHTTCDAEPLVYPHNHLLTVWSELGLVGSLSFFALTILFLFELKFWLNQDFDTAILGVAGAAIVVYWLGHGLVDVPYFKNDLSALWWVIFGLFTIRPSVGRAGTK